MRMRLLVAVKKIILSGAKRSLAVLVTIAILFCVLSFLQKTEVFAATQTKTFSFPSDVEGFIFTSGGKSSGSYSSSVGNPAGSLMTSSVGRNSADTSNWTWTGTWEAMGIPAGSTVTQIRLNQAYSRVTVWDTVDAITIGPYKLKDVSGIDQATLWSGRNPTGVEASWVATGQQSDQGVPSALQASNSTIKLYLERSIDLANDKNVGATLYDDEINFVVTYTPPVITIGSSGTQVSSANIPSANKYIGGALTFIRNSGTTNVTQIILKETGTVSANADLSNTSVYYETAGTCTYDGDETLFGTATSFNASEQAIVSGTMAVGTSQVCGYIVVDINSGASTSQTVDFEITNPSTDVTVSVGTVSPATIIAISGSTTLSGNQAPSVSSVDLNTGSAITLTENSTTTVTCTATITDTNGGSDISSATSTIYRSGISSTCVADDNNCYQISSGDCSLGDPSGNDRLVTCSAYIWFHADPTDSGTYSAETWQCKITATDSQGDRGSALDGTPPELNTLLALDVTSSIDYGTLVPGENSNTLDQQIVVSTTGNDAIDIEVSGNNMTSGGNSILVDYQHYATSSLSYGNGFLLSGIASPLELESFKPTNHPTNQSDVTYWGIEAPLGTAMGVYEGIVTFTATAD